ncbi:hypothetical protein BJY24_006332 [Nocardia transvalensis]|uniref:Uncharacterized protein n=1 Tax=Nocardia transvalensis TaxID=37333 RepID=A0A7W9PJT0_9NOCA|nr:hypothetical protein [Nocardia transvalensis]MBB5917420.1 hypothetical protein [Nocardia transvalensis]
MPSKSVTRLVHAALCLPAAVALTLSAATPAQGRDAAAAPTPLRVATPVDMVQPWSPTSFNWLAIQNPDGPEKALLTFFTSNIPSPQIISNITAPDGTYYNAVDWTPAPFVTAADPVSIHNDRLDWRFVPERDAWHLTVDDAMTQAGIAGITADVWFHDTTPGAAMDPVDWDGQQVFWASSIAAAKVDGWIRFPGQAGPTPVDGWVGEQERMAGLFHITFMHKGYEYAQAGNPDGSADMLFAFLEAGGGVRGVLAHTDPHGAVTMCEPSAADLSDWASDRVSDRGISLPDFDYPRRVHASCDGGGAHLERTFTATRSHLHPVWLGPSPIVEAVTTMADGHSDVPGSVATIQHLRTTGSPR